MNIIEILGNPAFGNIFIVIAAVIGFLSSYWLYIQRNKDRRSAIRRALKQEIESNSVLNTWAQDRQNRGNHTRPPSQIIQPVSVYQNNNTDLGLLTVEEIEALTDYYSRAIITNNILEWNRESRLQIDLHPTAVDENRVETNRDINEEIDRLALKRWKVVQILNKYLGNEYKPLERMELPVSAGDTVSKYHPVAYPILDELLERGYIEYVESDSDLLRLTEEGERYFSEPSEWGDQPDFDHELDLS